jgi:hypothetical protein
MENVKLQISDIPASPAHKQQLPFALRAFRQYSRGRSPFKVLSSH